MSDTAFAESAPLTLGVEEELMIVDAETLMPVPAVQQLIEDAEGGPRLPGRLKTELFASVVELNTNVCADARDASIALFELRAAAYALARDRGLRVVAAGTHPIARPEEQEIVDEPRYRKMVDYAGPSARRQGVNGLHVHVGMPDGDSCVRVLERVLPWLPVVLALSANSPYLAGEPTGMLSTRAELLALLPRSGAPPRFDSFAGWQAFVDELVAVGLIQEYTALWWDVRPHPRFGTLEFRIADQPTDANRACAYVALLQALCAAALEEPGADPRPGERAIYQQNRWAAARFGPRAELIHPEEHRMAPARELGEELLERVRPAAARLDSPAVLHAVVLDCEADRQLEVGADGDLHAVCADLVERTVPFTTWRSSLTS